MKKLFLLIAPTVILLTSSTSFSKEMPNDIKVKCAKDWGSDYKMQLFCRQEQFKALKALKDQDTPSAADKINFQNTPIWNAYTNTAIKVTGDIKISSDILLFKNGAKSQIKYIQSEGNSRLYEVVAPSKPLLNGNSICSDNDKSLFLITTIQEDSLGTNTMRLELTFSNAKDIINIDEESICATYAYTPSDDQMNFIVDEDIERKIYDSRVVDFCMNESGVNNPKAKKVLACVKAQNEALSNLPKTSDINSCVSYSTGYRMLGSMEYVDNVPVAKCMKRSNPRTDFANCVKKITGKTYRDGFIDWEYELSDKLASCFNRL